MNLFRLLWHSDIQAVVIYTYTIRNTSYSVTPCFCSPCYFPLTSLCSPLLTWKSSFGVMRPCPPWSQVARKLTSPFSSPPHPPLFQIPNSPPPLWVSPATPRLLRRRLDPGFQGPEQTCWRKFFLNFYVLAPNMQNKTWYILRIHSTKLYLYWEFAERNCALLQNMGSYLNCQTGLHCVYLPNK